MNYNINLILTLCEMQNIKIGSPYNSYPTTFLFSSIGNLKSLPALTTTLAMLGRSGIAGGWAAAQVFSAEVFPTVVR